MRPTFLDAAWDEELAYEFIGFNNALPWGKWDGEPVWDVPEGSGREVPSRELEAITQGYCPHDGSFIRWTSEIRRLTSVVNLRDWIFIDGGYWIRGSPG